MRVINLVDNISDINFGIWNASISTAKCLNEFGVQSELWYTDSNNKVLHIPVISHFLKDISSRGIDVAIRDKGLDNKKDIIVSHGCWRIPSKLGRSFADKGFVWIYTPHGMLEPWSLMQKWLKKSIYFKLYEKNYAKHASVIRAVSSTEQTNLKRLFPSSVIRVIPNGIPFIYDQRSERNIGQMSFLFMGRLHKKKGIVPLVKAWIRSTLNANKRFHLYIAGPDNGELNQICQLLDHDSRSESNISYIGTLNEEGKRNYFKKCDFFILPSYSEGFSTAVIEAMGAGLIPLISEGCNFPEAFEEGLAYLVEPEERHIQQTLEEIITLDSGIIRDKQRLVKEWTGLNFKMEIIARKQFQLYRSLLKDVT